MKIEPVPVGVSAKLGGHLVKDGATFRLWAPSAREVYLIWGNQDRAQKPTEAWRLTKAGEYFTGFLPGAVDGDLYRYWVVGPLGEGPKRDPHARELEWDGYPDCDCVLRDQSAYPWASANYKRKKPHQLALYQLHVGTFVSRGEGGQDMRSIRVGRFLDILDLFDHIVKLNVTGIQLLPIVEWQTTRSLGYNGTDIYSPEMDHFIRESEIDRYAALLNQFRTKAQAPPLDKELLLSGCNQLKALIDLFHLYDIAVFFDVVYNHLGGAFDDQSIRRIDFHATDDKPHGPYFQLADWAGGDILDYKIAPVRQFLIENAKAMIDEYRIDGIRYDEVTVIDEHGGWDFCKELTEELARFSPEVVNVAEYWKGDKSWIIADTFAGGAGFDAVWMDTLRDTIREALASAARGRQAFVNMTAIGRAFAPVFGDAESHYWRTVHYIENHDLHKAGNDDRKPRIAKLADGFNSRSWWARSRSRVANAMLLSAPGIPMIFMGQEILEDKYWSDNPTYYSDTLVWWDGLNQQVEMQQHLRFMQDFLKLRRDRPGLTGRFSKAYQVHDLNRVLILHRGTGATSEDIVVVFSLNENSLSFYEIGFPSAGTWYEIFNANGYEPGQKIPLRCNGEQTEAGGPACHNMPASARITIPANGVLVFARSPGA